MSSSLPDDINALKRLLAEQEALNRALQEKLNEREREIDHLQAQLDKLRRMNFGRHRRQRDGKGQRVRRAVRVFSFAFLPVTDDCIPCRLH